jgi:hypothetical protein
MLWVKDKLAGSLICGFTIAQEYKRNAAIHSPGDLCWSFFPFGPKPDSYQKRCVQQAHDTSSNATRRPTPGRKLFLVSMPGAPRTRSSKMMLGWMIRVSIPFQMFWEPIMNLQDDYLFLMTTGMVTIIALDEPILSLPQKIINACSDPTRQSTTVPSIVRKTNAGKLAIRSGRLPNILV